MMKYRIEWSGQDYPVPVVLFEEARYALAGEFLLAEARSFGPEIAAALAAPGTFAGNAFRLEIGPERTCVINDITGRECEVSTAEMRTLTADYLETLRRGGR